MIDTSRRSGINLSVMMLDWETAFDKVSHEGLHNAIDRMNVAEKIKNLIKQLYKNS